MANHKNRNLYPLVGALVLDTTGVKRKEKRGRKAKLIDPDKIRELYIDRQFTLAETAKELGVASLTLSRRMDEYGIPKRGRGRPVKGARNIVGKVNLDPNFEESDEAKAALNEMLAAEAAELAASESVDGDESSA